MSQQGSRRRGPRPADEDTRGAILVAARAEFSARGYDGATMRGIARAAGVDPRLVHHYFSGKDDLFIAAIGVPLRPEQLVAALAGATPGELGARAVRLFFTAWDPPENREVFRAVVGGSLNVGMIKQFVTRMVFSRVTEVLTAAGGAAAISSAEADLRVNLVASQLLGAGLVRYVIGLEPITSMDVEDLIDLVTPTVQGYLTGPLDS